jgi:hypothetical protein
VFQRLHRPQSPVPELATLWPSPNCKHGRQLTHLHSYNRAGWGLVVCMLSMLVSAWVEHRRLVLFHDGAFHKSTEPDLHHIRVVDMSVFWQIPQVRGPL